jgi:phage tail-like protein
MREDWQFMVQNQNTTRTRLFEYLPAIYQEEGSRAESIRLREFIEGFEKVLLGYDADPGAEKKKHEGAQKREDKISGLGWKIDQLHRLFDPEEAPRAFLPWLASWAALVLRSGMDIDRQRKLMARIIPLYKSRGTKKYLEDLLELCVDCDTSVHEEEIPALQLGVHSTLGEDARIGGGAPFFFRVVLTAPKLTAAEVQMRRQMAYEVVELAKPAHTTYEFEVKSPQLQVGVHSTIGLDSVLGPASDVKA